MANAHPMQEIIQTPRGIRFRENAIVRYLLDAGPFDMNHLARCSFSREDHEQFAQLIGYSVSGFGELSYASPEAIERADTLAASLSEVI